MIKRCKSCSYRFTLAYPPLIGHARVCLRCGAWSIGDHTVTLGANSITVGDAAADPGAVGIIQRNGSDLEYHNGTNVIRLGQQEAVIVLFVDGAQTVGTKKKNYNFWCPWGGAITEAYLYADTAPTGSALIADIELNGTSIWHVTSANRVQIAAAANSGSQTAFDTTSFAAGDIFTFDVAQIGSTVAGSDLVMMLKVREVRVS